MHVLYSGIFLLLSVMSSDTVLASESCKDLLEPLTPEEIQDKILVNWTLSEAYSTDPVDREALEVANSSWAVFIPETNGTINLEMAHMLFRNEAMGCVYHHFHGLERSNGSLKLNLTMYNASASFHFLRACNECLVMQLNASVPGYDLLTYMLVYAEHGELPEGDLQRTRKQAECLGFPDPPPFHYEGTGEFCPINKTAGIKHPPPTWSCLFCSHGK